MSTAAIPISFVQGFVGQCVRHGLDADETARMFEKYASAALLSRPEVYKGFTEGLQKAASCDVRKSAVARLMTPEVLALVSDVRVRFGDDLFSAQLRKEAGYPEPSIDNVPAPIRETMEKLAAAALMPPSMPLNQRVLIAALLGGVAGGGLRSVMPTDEDEHRDRGALDRLGLGAMHGAATGAGAALGSELGRGMVGPLNYGGRPLGGVLGAAGGGIAGHLLSKDLTR